MLMILKDGKLEAFLYRDGFVKQAPLDYDPNVIDKKVLLTNNTQRASTKVLDNKLVSELSDGEQIFGKSVKVLRALYLKLKPEIERTARDKGRLQINVMGPDLLFNANYDPYLLELNIINPAYYVKNNNDIVRNLKKKIADDILDNFLFPLVQTGNINLTGSQFIRL